VGFFFKKTFGADSKLRDSSSDRVALSTATRFFQSIKTNHFAKKDRTLSASDGLQDPKGGELYLVTAKPWETVVEAGRVTDVQIVCLSRA